MKVLFLDIDGVLAIFRTWMIYGSVFHGDKNLKTKLDPYGLEFIRKLEKLGVKIVLSSTWRKFVQLKDFSKDTGINFYDKTEILNTIRGDEIKEWLLRHTQVTKYCILDDDLDFHPDQLKCLVRTKYADGITHSKMVSVCRKLAIDQMDVRKAK